MSGNPMLDAQIARAVQPQFNPMQAIQQMQRPAVQMPVQNPIFGGTIPMQMPVQSPNVGGAIPMDFGMPQAAQIPVGYSNPLMNFKPSQEPIKPSQGSQSFDRNIADALWLMTTGQYDWTPTSKSEPIGINQGN